MLLLEFGSQNQTQVFQEPWKEANEKNECATSVPGMDAISWRFSKSLELPLGMGKLNLRQGVGLVLYQG